MAKCSVKGHTINSDPNPFEYSISNRIVLVHLWSSNTDLVMFQQDFLSFFAPTLFFSVTPCLHHFRFHALWISSTISVVFSRLHPHTSVSAFFFCFLPPEHFRSLLEWEWRLLGNLCSGKQRLKISDYKRGRERSGGITTFFFCMRVCKAGHIQTYICCRFCRIISHTDKPSFSSCCTCCAQI